MATRGKSSNLHNTNATLFLTSISDTHRIPNSLEHAREPLDGSVSEEVEDYELEQDDEEEEEGDEYDGLLNEMAIDEDVSEEARAGIEAFNERYFRARAHRRIQHPRPEAERTRREDDSPLGKPYRSLRDEFYDSNKSLYNSYKPTWSKERPTQEVSARRRRSPGSPRGHQEIHRRRAVSLGGDMKRQDKTSIESRGPDPSDLERYLEEATIWTLSDQRAFPGIDPARLPPSIEVEEVQEPGQGLGSIYQPVARITTRNDASSLPSESLAFRSTIPNIARRSVNERRSHPLRSGASILTTAEGSPSAGGDFDNSNPARTPQSKPGLGVPAIPDASRSKKRKSARRRLTGELGMQAETSREPSHSEWRRRPFRKRRRPADSPADEVPAPPLPGFTQSRRTRISSETRRLPWTEGTESRPPLDRRASTSTSSSSGLLQSPSGTPTLLPSSLSAFQAAAINAAIEDFGTGRPNYVPALEDSGTGRPDYIPALDLLPEAMRLRVYETLSHHGVNASTEQKSLLPNLDYCHTRHLVFTSELLPRSFAAQKRREILRIFRNKAPYVPACISSIPRKPKIQYYVTISRQTFRSHSPWRSLSKNCQARTLKELPVEIFEHIARYCSHDTLKNMRLVNKNFESKLSNRVFGTAVVPFNSGIYGMMVHDSPAKAIVDIEGKGKAGGIPLVQKFPAREVDDGMKIFKAWGNNVRKFAMAFEVDEEQLCNHPKKGKYEHHTTFWGPYKWPHPFYSRYEVVEGLEKKADEFRCMSLALSYLKEVRELGLSLDSGLGWIAGPDISDRARIFQEKPSIFGHSHPFHDLDAKRDWTEKLKELGLCPKKYQIDGKLITTAEGPLRRNAYDFYECTVHLDAGRPFLTFPDSDESSDPCKETLIFGGINLSLVAPNSRLVPNPLHHIRNVEHGTKDSSYKSASLVPNNLTTAQKEWLLETEWAQRAFLSSYCMALTDNSQAFENVESLTIAKLSSRYLAALQRDDFWKALPNLNTLTIKVSADFRDIQKTDSGIVEAPDIMPSRAATPFYKLVEGYIANVASIRTLNLGYFGGGEHQGGIFGRNQHVLPAPLYDFSNHHNTNIPSVLRLPYVEHLTLTNCWVAPATLISVVQTATPEMRKLTLNSVSLTTHYAGNEREPSPLENGVYPVPMGLPRLYDPEIGNLWASRGYTPDPNAQSSPNHWLITGGRKGSWRDVIDKITPGPTIDLLRYAYQHMDIPPKVRTGPLERIDFVSCGYVRLPDQEGLDQDGIGEIVIRPPIASLEKRAMDLIPVMMHRNSDLLLGQIVPSLPEEELAIFRECFPMTIGWGDDNTKYHNHEDGQPTGGCGRFSGHVEKLTFDPTSSLLPTGLLELQNRSWSYFSRIPR